MPINFTFIPYFSLTRCRTRPDRRYIVLNCCAVPLETGQAFRRVVALRVLFFTKLNASSSSRAVRYESKLCCFDLMDGMSQVHCDVNKLARAKTKTPSQSASKASHKLHVCTHPPSHTRRLTIVHISSSFSPKESSSW